MLAKLALWVDATFAYVDSEKSRNRLERGFVAAAVLGFLGHLGVIAVSRNAPDLAEACFGGLDRNYLHAVYTPFSFILIYEVLLLVLALPRSHTSSIEKQYQIVSLIIIRRVFKDLGGFTDLEPWIEQPSAAWAVLLDMLGAAGMFILVTAFARARRGVRSGGKPPEGLAYFITIKRAVALLLGLLLTGLAILSVGRWLGAVFPAQAADVSGVELDGYFFPAFFEVMIFTDVFLLILSIAFYDQYELVFRNAGFVISTVLLRASLTSPRPYDLGLGLLAMVYGLAILLVFRWFQHRSAEAEPDAAETAPAPG